MQNQKQLGIRRNAHRSACGYFKITTGETYAFSGPFEKSPLFKFPYVSWIAPDVIVKRLDLVFEQPYESRTRTRSRSPHIINVCFPNVPEFFKRRSESQAREYHQWRTGVAVEIPNALAAFSTDSPTKKRNLTNAAFRIGSTFIRPIDPH